MDVKVLQNIILFLSLTPIALLVVIVFMYLKMGTYKKEISELKSRLGKQKNREATLLKFYPGSKGLLNNYQLIHTPTKTTFYVSYEVEVVDVSEDQLKVNALSYQSNDDYAKDPKNRQAIIGFLQGRWVNKSEVQIIIDESHKRHLKLEELGII